MIDAISSVYSSYHGGRNQNRRVAPTFSRIVKGEGDDFVRNREKKQTSLGKALFIGGSLAAACFILSVLGGEDGLKQTDSSQLKNIARVACIIGCLSILMFGAFKLVEKLVIKDEEEEIISR